MQGQESVYWPVELRRFWTDAATFNDILNFLLANSVITDPILWLLLPIWIVNLKGCIFLKKINHLLIVLHLAIFTFLRIYSQNRYFRGFPFLPKYAGLTYRKPFKKSFRGFFCGDGISASFLKIIFLKSLNSLNFSLFHYQALQKSLRENKKLQT